MLPTPHWQVVEKVVHTQVPVHREEHFCTPVYTQQVMQQPAPQINGCLPTPATQMMGSAMRAPAAYAPMSCCQRPY